MKGDLTLTLLKIIQTTGIITADILDTITYYGYNETYRRMKGLKSSMPERKKILEKSIQKIQERQKISKLLSKLKKEGLIAKEVSGSNPWNITHRGKEKILQLQKYQRTSYEIKKSNEIKIIIFDIPETKRQSRAWLRESLKNLDFNMLQKSVWIGKNILPENFLEDLRQQEISSYVEIFAISKTGTIKQIQ